VVQPYPFGPQAAHAPGEAQGVGRVREVACKAAVCAEETDGFAGAREMSAADRYLAGGPAGRAQDKKERARFDRFIFKTCHYGSRVLAWGGCNVARADTILT
jgi:hypothetical protein